VNGYAQTTVSFDLSLSSSPQGHASGKIADAGLIANKNNGGKPPLAGVFLVIYISKTY
jgi:hypothetical protein